MNRRQAAPEINQAAGMRGVRFLYGLANAAFLVIASTGIAADPSPTPAASSPAAATATVPVPAPIAEKGYHLVKNWDFGSTIATKEQLTAEFYTRYVYGNGTCNHFNDEWQRFRDNNNHVFKDQVLNLTARVTGTAGLKNGAIESGMIRSKWTGKYGYYECCLKVPRGRGMWPAFWLNPQDGQWPPEIDILEVVNSGRNSETTRDSYHYLHNRKDPPVTLSSKLNKLNAYTPGFDYADGFHTFSVEWTPDNVTHYVDGVEVVSRRFHWTHDNGKDGGPAHVLLNLAVGGKWPGDPQSVADFPAELAVKYIRVWQQDAPAAK
jgi:beta-glucanase (GH16 family)